MTSVYRTPPAAIAIHASGFHRLRSGVWVSKLPAVETTSELFAHTGQRTAREWCEARGLRLASVETYERMRLEAFHIEPFVLPTAEMLVQAERPGDGPSWIQRYREANMMGLEWCSLHDAEVRARLAGWDGEKPVDNAGKHWAAARPSAPKGHGTIVGWWTTHARSYGVSNDVQIQTPSDFHDDQYSDYATTWHAEADEDPFADPVRAALLMGQIERAG